MLPELSELRKQGIYVSEEIYNVSRALLECGFTTNDLLATGITQKFFSDYFAKGGIHGFDAEVGEYFADLLNEVGEGLLIDVAREKVDGSCFRYKYSEDYTCSLSGMAELQDGSYVYVCLVLCNIVDKNDKYVASSVFCFTYTDASMETPAGIDLYGFQSGNVCVSGNLEEFVE